MRNPALEAVDVLVGDRLSPRFVASVSADRSRWEASADDGATRRNDFDLVFERTDAAVPAGDL